MAKPSSPSLQERLNKALDAQQFLQQLRAKVYLRPEQYVLRMTESLPISAIPFALAWAVAVVLSHMDKPRMGSLVFIAGLFGLVVACSALYFSRWLFSRRAVPDAVLATIADHHHQLAYYPNGQLKLSLRNTGYVSRAEFYIWLLEQEAILATKIKDHRARLSEQSQPRRPKVPLGPGAERFLNV